jgi:hypothetical protein
MQMSNTSQIYHQTINPNFNNNKQLLNNPLIQTMNSNATSTQFYPAQVRNTAYFNNESIGTVNTNNQVFHVRTFSNANNNQDSLMTKLHPMTLTNNKYHSVGQSYVVPNNIRHV